MILKCSMTFAILLAFLTPMYAQQNDLTHSAPRHKIHEEEQTGQTVLHQIDYLKGDSCGWIFAPPMEFFNSVECTVVASPIMRKISKKLNRISAMSVGGWFYTRRQGEQIFFWRGIPEVDPLGNRMFPPNEQYVNFCLGTDQRGFFYGVINGNGSMPFPRVTVNEVPINTWNQLIVVKDTEGFQKFYQNGTLIHTDQESSRHGISMSFSESRTDIIEPVRLSVPLGGRIGEAWIVTRELTAEEIKQDFINKRRKYLPASPGKPVQLREMNVHNAADLWEDLPRSFSKQFWQQHRTGVIDSIMKIIGPFPKEVPSLAPMMISEEDCGDYIRRKVSITVQNSGIRQVDQMAAYLLVPKDIRGKVPAIICMYGTTAGAGKETTVGLSGSRPGTLPEKNLNFGVTMVQAGFVVFAPDYLRDGERVWGEKPYSTANFYDRFTDWSLVGKDIWDNMRAVDYLQSLAFVDSKSIGMTGHSYGGHSTIFAAALEPRISVVVSNGPVSSFLHHGMHWGVPKGASNSQSLPALRPYLIDRFQSIPVTFYQFTSLIAPRPLLVGQASGERRPIEEENYAAVRKIYQNLEAIDHVKYHWYGGDHDYPPEAQQAAIEWFKRWFKQGNSINSE